MDDCGIPDLRPSLATISAGLVLLSENGRAPSIEPLRLQGRDRRLAMADFLQLDDDVERGALRIERKAQPLVADIDDVGAFGGEYRRQLGQCAGTVGDRHVEPHEVIRAHGITHDHAREHARIDIAAGQRHADLAARESLGMRKDRGERGGAGAFDHRFLDPLGKGDRVGADDLAGEGGGPDYSVETIRIAVIFP